MSKYINKIIYINLDKRSDRLNEIQNELQNFNLIKISERYSAIYHSMGIVGCGQSHLSVIKIAKERKYENILILEDDFYFTVSKDEFEKNLNLFFESNIDYDVCMLSYNLIKYEELPEYPFLLKVLDAQTASGYIINEKYYDVLIKLYEEAMPLLESTKMHWIYANDQIWKKKQITDKWYCFTPLKI
jgi:GR25 family glycosyltransferase involved in LPS biosynthesis